MHFGIKKYFAFNNVLARCFVAKKISQNKKKTGLPADF